MNRSLFLVFALFTAPVVAAPWKTQAVPSSKAPGTALLTFSYRAKAAPRIIQLTATFADGAATPLLTTPLKLNSGRSWKTCTTFLSVPSGARRFTLEGMGSGYTLRSVKVRYKARNDRPGTTGKGTPTGKEIVTSSNPAFEQQVFALVNVERAKAGVKALRWNEALARAARYHALDMSVDNYASHDTMDRDAGGNLVFVCLSCWRMWYFCGDYGGENIAGGQATPEQVVAEWMASPTHRANILWADYASTAVGYVNGHWVQDFLYK